MASSPDTFNMDSKKDIDVAELPSPTASVVDDYDSKPAKVAYRKADIRILLFYSVVYLFMRINVSNITNTAIINIDEGDGIKKQLGNLTSSQWAWVIAVFYYPYMLFEPASTVLLKRFSPSTWMCDTRGLKPCPQSETFADLLLFYLQVSDNDLMGEIHSTTSLLELTTIGRHLHVPGRDTELRWHYGDQILPWLG